MIEVKEVHPSPAAGYNFAWACKMAAMPFAGASETTESIPHPRTLTRSTKGIPSTFVWLYAPAPGGAKLAMQAATMAPVPRPGKLAEAFIVKQNENEAELLLANLKARMES